MKIRRTVVVLDAADVEAESACWAGLLGGTRSASAATERRTVELSPERQAGLETVGPP